MSEPSTLPMRAFLRMRAGTCVAADTTRGMVLVVGDTAKLFPDGITVQWLGKDAADFYDQHREELTSGRCLDLELFNFRCLQNQLRASVKTCRLAPLAPSRTEHADKPTTNQPTPQPTQGQRTV